LQIGIANNFQNEEEKTMRLLLRGLIASMVLWVTLPAQSQVSEPQIEAMVEALRQAAPKTGTQNNGLYSEWQVQTGHHP
jgi:hypothetical protein